MRISLQNRMILAQGALILLIWLISISIGLWEIHRSNIRSFDDTLEDVSIALVMLLRDEKDPARIRVNAQRIEQLDKAFTHISFLESNEHDPIYQILDAHGRMVYRSANAPAGIMTRKGPGLHTVDVGDESFRIWVRDGSMGAMRVLVAVPRSLLQRIAWRSLRATPWWLLGLFAALVGFVWLISRWALKPLRLLTEGVKARSPQDLSPLIGHADLVETQPLIKALNRLFHRVEELLGTQRGFISDAARGLQAPLVVIQEEALVLLRGSAERRPAATLRLQQEVDLAAQLVGQLLTIARLDAADSSVTMTSMDLAALVQERVGAMVSMAVQRGQDLGYEGPSSLRIIGSVTVATQMLDSLLADAIRCATDGGLVTFRLQSHGSEVLLELEDSGQAVSAWAGRERLNPFDQHQELAGSRYGLGLAIARRATERHGGSMTVSSNETGLLVSIHLPCGVPE